METLTSPKLDDVAVTTSPPRVPPELPVALLGQILRLACADGAVPTAARVACVSRAWRDAAAFAGATLWRAADLSYGWCRVSDAIVARLCTRGTWAQLEQLNVSGCRLTDAALHAIAAHCPVLDSLDVSDSHAFSAAALARVVCAPRRVRDLNLARVVMRPAGGFEGAVRSLLTAAAPSLERLSLAGNLRVSSTTVRALLSCSKLRSLDLTGAGTARGVAVPLEALQLACPLLEELRLSGLGLDGGATFPAADAAPNGFARLRVCELASGTRMTSHGAVASTSVVDDALLLRVLHNSSALRWLALGGTHVSAVGLAALPALQLERLLLEHSAAACDGAADVAAARWATSLLQVSLAGGGGNVTDAAAASLARCTQLRACDLSGTTVTSAGVRALLLAAPALRDLTLASCRALDRPVRLASLSGDRQLRAALGLMNT